jgi:enoyl-CoA hydratase/carnithine racemase
VRATAEGHLLLIEIDRQQKANAFTPVMFAELAGALEILEEQADLRCGVLFAAGRNFTGGLDLPLFAEAMARGEPVTPHRRIDPFGLREPVRSKPLVIAVQGWCLTLGVELVLAADFSVAASDTRFAQLEVARGIMPICGATFRLAERAGWGNAMRYLLTGDVFDAVEAYRLGLVQEVVEPGEQVERAKVLAGQVARQAPLAVQACLKAARTALETDRSHLLDELYRLQERLYLSEDSKEGLRAFQDRRNARFMGR